ncbi:hypothetical protein [Promicromonospora sp. NPDC090134]|uniref:hypothetical protein n=1 Tax=Promicromonospora sp. NPDC090134 TaxID=3364408 RepID=UPI0038275903
MTGDRLLTSLEGASWLPPGGRAEAVLAAPNAPVPTPVGLVRLLVDDESGRLFCVPRTGGRPGVDLPTTAVTDGDTAAALDRLTRAVFGQACETTLVGFIRNTVPEGVVYEWPSPVAHFTVHRPASSGVLPAVDGVWLHPVWDVDQLSERHWWPLVAVDHDAAAAMSDDLLIAWGLWLDGVDRDRDRIVSSATDALVLGLDSPGLRELAGLDHAVDWGDVDSLILQAAVELHLPRPTNELALRAELERHARQILRGQETPGALTVWAYRRVGHEGPRELLALVRLDDEYAMLEEVPGYWEIPDRSEQVRALDEVVRSAAAAIVAGETDLSRFMPGRWRDIPRPAASGDA